MSVTDRFIVIPGWRKFQHYHDRHPFWIKDYLDQHDRDEYMELTLALRGLLQDVRRLYARRHGVLRGDARSISHALNVRVTEKQLQALNHAGFIEFSSSKLLERFHKSSSPEKEKEKEKDSPKSPHRKTVDGRRVTGWKLVRGSHGVTHVPDPFGTDTPPADAVRPQ